MNCDKFLSSEKYSLTDFKYISPSLECTFYKQMLTVINESFYSILSIQFKSSSINNHIINTRSRNNEHDTVNKFKQKTLVIKQLNSQYFLHYLTKH